jgi:hypothetical protein
MIRWLWWWWWWWWRRRRGGGGKGGRGVLLRENRGWSVREFLDCTWKINIQTENHLNTNFALGDTEVGEGVLYYTYMMLVIFRVLKYF